MLATINIDRQVLFLGGTAHYLTRQGIDRAYAVLQSEGRLLWGWPEYNEFTFEVAHEQNYSQAVF